MKMSKQKKKARILTALFYSLVAVIFVSTLTIVLIFANGYKPSFKNGRLSLEKTGMLIVSSRPSNAQLTLNGHNALVTGFYFLPSRVSGLLPGWYDVALTKKGYRSWTNRLQIEPGLVTWANYALLFPNNLDITQISKVSSGYLGSNENGHNMLFSGKKGDNFTVTSYDTANLSEKSFWPTNLDSLPDYIKNPTVLSGMIDNENNRVLLNVKNGDGVQAVVLDASGSEVKLTLLTDLLKSTPTMMTFNPNNGNDLYLKMNNNLYRYSVSNKALGDSLADGIVSYDVEQNQQVYFATRISGSTNKISRMNLDGANKAVIYEANMSEKGYKFAHSNFNDTLAMVNLDSGELTLISPTTGDNTVSTKLTKGITGIVFHKDGKKLLFYSPQTINRYDLEKKKLVSSKTDGDIVNAAWYLDDAHFWVNSTKSVSIEDYDGANQVKLSAIPSDAFIPDDRDNNAIFAENNSGKTLFSKFVSPF